MPRNQEMNKSELIHNLCQSNYNKGFDEKILEEDFKDEVIDEGFHTSNKRSKQEDENNDVQSNYTAVFCRFCWDYANSIEDPLLSVCKCSGGVGFIHYTCLKRWLQTKMKRQGGVC